MKLLLGLSTVIDAITVFIGRAVSWLVLAAVLVSAGNAIVRKIGPLQIGSFSLVSSNAWLEAQWYLYAAVFLLAAAYTLQRNEHVRIDVVFGQLSKRTQNWINLLGHIFMLMPFSILMIYESAPFVLKSFNQQDYSGSAGGLIIWPAKALVLAGFILLAMQGVSEIIKRIAVMMGRIPDPHEEGHHSSVQSLAPAQEQLP